MKNKVLLDMLVLKFNSYESRIRDLNSEIAVLNRKLLEKVNNENRIIDDTGNSSS